MPKQVINLATATITIRGKVMNIINAFLSVFGLVWESKVPEAVDIYSSSEYTEGGGCCEDNYRKAKGLTEYAIKYKLSPQSQQVLNNLLLNNETRIEEYVNENPRFDLASNIRHLRNKGFVIQTVDLTPRKITNPPCKYVYRGRSD